MRLLAPVVLAAAGSAPQQEVKDCPVYPADLIGSIYDLLGIDTSARLPHPSGQATRVVPALEDGVKLGGRLKEIL